MPVFFRAGPAAADGSKPVKGGRVIAAVGLLLVLFFAALLLKAQLAWSAPAETALTCVEILFTALVALFGFEGTKFW